MIFVSFEAIENETTRSPRLVFFYLFFAACPPQVAAIAKRCEEVNASIVLAFQGGGSLAQIAARDQFAKNLTQAINTGGLQDALNSVNNQSIAFILNGWNGSGAQSGSSGISSGGVAGIVIGAAAAVFLIAAYVNLSRRSRDGKPSFDELEPAPRDVVLGEERDADESSSQAVASKSSELLGATSPDYGKPKKIEEETEKQVEEVPPSELHHDSSSNAGSSGWSSSAGVSSLNTGSADGLDDPVVGIAAGSTLAAIGAASRSAVVEEESGSAPSVPSVSRADLDSAIEAGDWAAVGATAALLAAASDSQSYSSRSGPMSGTRSQGGSSVSSLDAARAAELDHLVDAGDWE